MIVPRCPSWSIGGTGGYGLTKVHEKAGGGRGRPPPEPGARGSDLAPAGYPGPVAHLVVTEQGGRLGAHQLADLAEHQPDLLLGPGIGPRLDGVPQRAD